MSNRINPDGTVGLVSLHDTIQRKLAENIIEEMKNPKQSEFERFSSAFNAEATELAITIQAVDTVRKAVADYSINNVVPGEVLGRIMEFMEKLSRHGREM